MERKREKRVKDSEKEGKRYIERWINMINITRGAWQWTKVCTLLPPLWQMTLWHNVVKANDILRDIIVLCKTSSNVNFKNGSRLFGHLKYYRTSVQLDTFTNLYSNSVHIYILAFCSFLFGIYRSTIWQCFKNFNQIRHIYCHFSKIYTLWWNFLCKQY